MEKSIFTDDRSKKCGNAKTPSIWELIEIDVLEKKSLHDEKEVKKSVNLRMHREDKSHKCNQCDYASVYGSALRKHLKLHSGEKSKCSHCDLAFTHTGHLKTHLITHSLEKPNKCNRCYYSSSYARALKTHLKTQK